MARRSLGHRVEQVALDGVELGQGERGLEVDAVDELQVLVQPVHAIERVAHHPAEGAEHGQKPPKMRAEMERCMAAVFEKARRAAYQAEPGAATGPSNAPLAEPTVVAQRGRRDVGYLDNQLDQRGRVEPGLPGDGADDAGHRLVEKQRHDQGAALAGAAREPQRCRARRRSRPPLARAVSKPAGSRPAPSGRRVGSRDPGQMLARQPARV